MEEKKVKVARLRSPNFPYISLERAIELIRILFKNYRRSLVPFDTAMTTLEFSPKSSKAKQVMAALSSYGLADTEGKGDDKQIKISDLGYNVIIDDRPVSVERDRFCREAALSPNLFKTLYEKFPHNIPSDEVLSHELKVRHDFNPDSVLDFIKVYRQTMTFAKVYESGIMEEENTGSVEQEPIRETGKAMTQVLSPRPSHDTKVFGVPMPDISEREIANYPIKGGTIRLLASGPVTQKAIDKLIKMLELSKEEFPENDQPIVSDPGNEQT